jgi:hypothetical protein
LIIIGVKDDVFENSGTIYADFVFDSEKICNHIKLNQAGKYFVM